MSDLRDELVAIRGVGEATADAILEVLESHNSHSDELAELVEQSWDYYRVEQYEYAGRFLEEAHDRVTE